MKKKLSEMSLEELWELFPIILTEYQEQWDSWYSEEKDLLYEMLSKEQIARISHIGSTAIKGIWAKPIVDILIEVYDIHGMNDIKEILVEKGYAFMWQNDKRMSFNKGYTEDGFAEKVYHLHIRISGDNDELYFRDYLNENVTIAKQYEELKLSLWKEFEHNRDGYTEAKAEFVSECTQKAKLKFGHRY